MVPTAVVFTFAWVVQLFIVTTTGQAVPSANLAVHKRFWRPETQDATIKIGTPITLAAGAEHFDTSQTMINAWELFFEWLNQDRHGILVDGVNHSVELVLHDDMSLPEVAAWATDNLIRHEGIDHFLGPYSSTLTEAVSPVVQAAGKVQVAPGSSVTSVFQPRDQVFGTLPPTSKWLEGAMEVVGAAASGARKSLMYLAEDVTFTQTACQEVPRLASLHNFEIVENQIDLAAGTESEISNAVERLEARQPDVVVACVYSSVCQLLLARMTERRYSPKALITTLCVVEERFLHTDGLAGLFSLGVSPWLPDRDLQGEAVTGDWTALSFAESFTRRFPDQLTYRAASAFVAAATLVFAIETAGTREPAAAAAVLRNMSEDSMWGLLAFDSNGQGSNKLRVTQLHPHKTEIVFPPTSATATLLYPKPDWLQTQCIHRRSAPRQAGFGFIDETCQECPRGWTSLEWDYGGTMISVCAACPPGTVGLRSGNFTNCVPCPQGLFSNETASKFCYLCTPGSFTNVSGQTACTACPEGTFVETAAASFCNKCETGYFQDSEGETTCRRCFAGRYSDRKESSACEDCPQSFTTQGTGFTSASDCGCPLGTYNLSSFDVSAAPNCVACPSGVNCPGFVEPDLLPGFYQEQGDFNPSHGVWKCSPAASCPGGPPGTCAGLLTGRACAQCPVGKTWSQADSTSKPVCRDCSAGNATFLVLLPFFFMAGLAAVYYLANSPIVVVTTTNLAISIVLGICLAIVQVVGMLGQLVIIWPDNMLGLINLSKVSISDSNALGVACSVGPDPFDHYLTLFLVPWVSVIALMLMSILSKSLPLLTRGNLKAWPWQRVFNTLCQVGQTVFITITATAASPLQCYAHPNGQSTIVSYPSVVCWHSGHTPFILMSIALLSCFVFPFCSVAAWGSYTTYTSSQQYGMEAPQLMMYRFLIYRFRASVWWWGNVWNLRQLLLGLTPLITPDDTGNQLIFVLVVLILYLVASTSWLPWRTVEVNILDLCSTLFLICLAIILMSFAPPEYDEDRRVALLACMFALTFCCIVVSGLYGLVQMYCHGKGGRFGYQYPPDKELGRFSDFLHSIARAMASLSHDDTEKMVREMTTLDRIFLLKVFDTVLLTNLVRYDVQLPVRRGSFIKTLRLVTPINSGNEEPTVRKAASMPVETASVQDMELRRFASIPADMAFVQEQPGISKSTTVEGDVEVEEDCIRGYSEVDSHE